MAILKNPFILNAENLGRSKRPPAQGHRHGNQGTECDNCIAKRGKLKTSALKSPLIFLLLLLLGPVTVKQEYIKRV